MKVLLFYALFLVCIIHQTKSTLLCDFLPGVEFEYNVLEDLVAASVDDCCLQCSSKIECVAFTFYRRSGKCSLKHTESVNTNDRRGAISGRKAAIPPPPPLPGAVPLNLWTLENSALMIYLFGADIPTDVYQSTILTIPRVGHLYEVVGNGIGSLITEVPHLMSDSKHRVIYVLRQANGVDSFDFAIVQENSYQTATATISVLSDKMEVTCDNTEDVNATHVLNIGEVKTIQLTHEETLVPFSRPFKNAVVIAQPLSWNDRNGGAVARITNVTPTGFTIKIQEAPSSDGTHEVEEVTYIALEVGSWRLEDGSRVEVGKVVTDATAGQKDTTTNTWEVVHFPSGTLFSKPPVVLSQVQTLNDFHWVKTRQKSISSSSFAVTLEEEQANEIAHGGEIVGWIAVEPRLGHWSGLKFESGVESGVQSKWRDRWHTLNFNQQFDRPPLLISMLTSFDDPDPAHLRYRRITTKTVDIRIEEDQETDYETRHYEEKVSFLAIEPPDTISTTPSTTSNTTIPTVAMTLQATPAECYLLPTAYDLMATSEPTQITLITLKDLNERKEVFAVILTLPTRGTLFQYSPLPDNDTLFLNNTITDSNTVVSDSLGRVLYQAYDQVDPSTSSDSFTYLLKDSNDHISNVATVSVQVLSISEDTDPVKVNTVMKTKTETFVIIVGMLGFVLSAVVLTFFGIFLYKRKAAREQLQGFLSLSDAVVDEEGGTTYFSNKEGKADVPDVDGPEEEEDDLSMDA